jgi:SUMO ligase MMS21 Smc5/6 complex component
VAWLVNAVVTEEEKRTLKAIALELHEIRKQIMQFAETLVKLSDKEFLKSFNAEKDELKEHQINQYKEKLEKQVDIAEREFRT